MENRDPAPPAPGTAAPAPPLPDKPRLRPLDAYMIDNPTPDPSAPKLLVLRDPSGLATEQVTLQPMGAMIVDLCDGERTHDEICAEFLARYKRPLAKASLVAMLTRLDQALMLDSPRLAAHARALYEEFAHATVRKPVLAGSGYSSDPARLREELEATFARPNGPGIPAPDAYREDVAPLCPRAIIAPHIDMRRGGPAYAWAYRSLLVCRDLPSLVVVLGTSTSAMDAVFTLTKKSYDTPLGPLSTATGLVDGLLKDAAEVDAKLPERLMYDEYQHRNETALELQMLWLRYVLWRRRVPEGQEPKVLPILCGPLSDYITPPGQRKPAPLADKEPTEVGWPQSSYGPFLALLRKRLAGERVLWICAAELAHVGPRFGDREALTEADCDSLERRDKATLRPVCAGDAKGFLSEIRREGDARRVSGLSPIYAMLAAHELLGAPLSDGALRCYAQCQGEAGSIVSIASLVYPTQQ